ncbi:hypothetical protein [Inquilinus sp.]|uniref:hypothetical protein n=1 Tax=Inquilinus sp. TaxID=1932117 RepID=UPI003782FF26
MTKSASTDRQMVVGDLTYTLRYGVRAMAALQDHYKLASFDEVGQRLGNPKAFGAGDIVAILWAGLRTHHRDLTMDDAMDLVDGMGLDEVQEVIGKAFDAGSPPANAEGQSGAVAGTGPR